MITNQPSFILHLDEDKTDLGPFKKRMKETDFGSKDTYCVAFDTFGRRDFNVTGHFWGIQYSGLFDRGRYPNVMKCTYLSIWVIDKQEFGCPQRDAVAVSRK